MFRRPPDAANVLERLWAAHKAQPLRAEIRHRGSCRSGLGCIRGHPEEPAANAFSLLPTGHGSRDARNEGINPPHIKRFSRKRQVNAVGAPRKTMSKATVVLELSAHACEIAGRIENGPERPAPFVGRGSGEAVIRRGHEARARILVGWPRTCGHPARRRMQRRRLATPLVGSAADGVADRPSRR